MTALHVQLVIGDEVEMDEVVEQSDIDRMSALAIHFAHRYVEARAAGLDARFEVFDSETGEMLSSGRADGIVLVYDKSKPEPGAQP